MSTRLTPTLSKLMQVGPLRSTSALRAASPLTSLVRLKRGGGLRSERSVLWFGPPSLVWLVAIGAAPGGDPGAAASIWGHFPPLRNPFGSPAVRQPVTYLTAPNPGRSLSAPLTSGTVPASRAPTAANITLASPPALARVAMTGLRAPVSDGRSDAAAPPAVATRLTSESPRTGVPSPPQAGRRPAEVASQPPRPRKIPLKPPAYSVSAGQAPRPIAAPYASDAKPVVVPRPLDSARAAQTHAAAAPSETAAQPIRSAPVAPQLSPAVQTSRTPSRLGAFQWPASSFRTPLKPYSPPSQRRFRQVEPSSASVEQPEAMTPIAPARVTQAEERGVWAGLRAPAVWLVPPQLRAASEDGRPQAPMIQAASTTLLRAIAADPAGGARVEATSVAASAAPTRPAGSAPVRPGQTHLVGRLAPRRDALLVMPVPGLPRMTTGAVTMSDSAQAQVQPAPQVPPSARTTKSSPVFAGIASTLRFIRRSAVQSDVGGDVGSPIRVTSPTARPAEATRSTPQPTGGTGPRQTRPASSAAMTPPSVRLAAAQAPSPNPIPAPARPLPPSTRPASASAVSPQPVGSRKVRRFPGVKSVASAPGTQSPSRLRSTPTPTPPTTVGGASAPSESGTRARPNRQLIPAYFSEPARIWLYNAAKPSGSTLRGSPLLVASGSPLGSVAAGWSPAPVQPGSAPKPQAMPVSTTYVSRPVGPPTDLTSTAAGPPRPPSPRTQPARVSERWSVASTIWPAASTAVIDGTAALSYATAGPNGRPVWSYPLSAGVSVFSQAKSSAFGPRHTVLHRDFLPSSAGKRGTPAAAWTAAAAPTPSSRPEPIYVGPMQSATLPMGGEATAPQVSSGRKAVHAVPIVPMTNLRSRTPVPSEAQPAPSAVNKGYFRKSPQAQPKKVAPPKPLAPRTAERMSYTEWVADQRRTVENTEPPPRPAETPNPTRRPPPQRDIRALAEVELLEVLTSLAGRDPIAASILHDIGRELDDISRLDRMRLL